MAKLPTFKRVVKEDFGTENQELIEKLGFLMNSNFEPLYNVLNKGLTVSDNLNQQIASVRVKVDASGRPLVTLDVRLNIAGAVQGLLPIACSPFPDSAPWINFQQTSANILKIQSILGLTANTEYTIKFLIIGS